MCDSAEGERQGVVAMRKQKISTEGWAAIYELIAGGVPLKSIALEFGIGPGYMVQRIRKFEREGL